MRLGRTGQGVANNRRRGYELEDQHYRHNPVTANVKRQFRVVSTRPGTGHVRECRHLPMMGLRRHSRRCTVQAVQRLLTLVRAPQIAGAVASMGKVGVRSLTPSTLSYFLLWL